MKVLLKLLSHSWLLPRTPVWLPALCGLFCRSRRRHINAEVRLSVGMGRAHVSCIFFLCELQRSVGSNLIRDLAGKGFRTPGIACFSGELLGLWDVEFL